MKDLFSRLSVVAAISPQADADNTPLVSAIIDLQGYNSCMFAIASGALVDADAQFTVLIEDGADPALADHTAVADGFLRGTEAAASFAFSDDNMVKKIGYVGNKRYVRLTITPVGNSSAANLAAIAVLGDAANQPAA